MSIASEITRISGNIADAYTALGEKGATLPAAGSQNSANLADTIATVSTGGGASFTAFDTIVENALASVKNKTFAQLHTDSSTNGFYVSKYKQSDNTSVVDSQTGWVVGAMYNDTLDVLTIKISKDFAFLCPSGCSITDNTDNSASVVEVSYPVGVEKYIVIAGMSTNYMKINDIRVSYGNIGNNNGFLRASLKYMYTCMRNEVYTQASPCIITLTSDSVNNTTSVFSRLEGIKFSSNIKFNISNLLISSNNIRAFCFPKSISLEDFFEKHVADVTYQTTILSNSVSENIISDLHEWQNRDDFPFILDLSTSTRTGTWYLSTVDGWTSSWNSSKEMNSTGFTKVKIKLPSVRNISLSENGDRIISPEYLRYWADNAPSVTSKSLYLGYTYDWYATNHPEIISIFTGKGWSVSQW